MTLRHPGELRVRGVAYDLWFCARYAIDDSSTNWGMAEAQVAKLANGGAGGKSTVVSVKTTVSGQKRKAEDSEDKLAKEKKSARRSMKKAKR